MSKGLRYICINCEKHHVKEAAFCGTCREYNTIVAREVDAVSSSKDKNRFSGYASGNEEVKKMNEIDGVDDDRYSSGIEELDRVFGGGIVVDGVALLGGEPGIGKSTLLLQLVSEVARSGKNALYVSGEESNRQIAKRASRLEIDNTEEINISSKTNIEDIINDIEKHSIDLVIIDSIQTMYTPNLASIPGSLSQIKEVALRITKHCKSNGVACLMIGHVTKDGDLAGPKALEHMVDTVLYFEGDSSEFRMIRAIKNRYGQVNEVGIFEMTERGLISVSDPGGVFINKEELPGACVYVTQDGNRSMLVEVQSLLSETEMHNPIRNSIGYDSKRLQMITALVHKIFPMTGILRSNVFVSLIGGIKVIDTGADVATMIAMLSSSFGMVMPKKVAAFGEIGLTGEIRNVNAPESRIREAARLGVKEIITPVLRVNKKSLESSLGIKIIECKSIHDVYNAMQKVKLS